LYQVRFDVDRRQLVGRRLCSLSAGFLAGRVAGLPRRIFPHHPPIPLVFFLCFFFCLFFCFIFFVGWRRLVLEWGLCFGVGSSCLVRVLFFLFGFSFFFFCIFCVGVWDCAFLVKLRWDSGV